MTGVVDVTNECAVGRHCGPMRAYEVAAIWIHRIGPHIGRDAVEIAEFFINGPGKPYTGGAVPYHYIGGYNEVQQAIPLNERGAHARRWGNACDIGFAQMGDCRQAAPGADQWRRAVMVCADIVPALVPLPLRLRHMVPDELRYGLPVFGHGEVPGTFGRSAGKEQPGGPNACPGNLWDMNDFRSDVAIELRARVGLVLTANGHRLDSPTRRT